MNQRELARAGEVSFRQVLDVVGSCLHNSVIQMDLKEVEAEINTIHANMQVIAQTLEQALRDNELRHLESEHYTRGLKA